MAQPYIGEIRLFGGNFAPAGWMFCDGQLLSISENELLFTLIGTTYGGDGESVFALPDLRGRAPLHKGHGTGLSTYVLADTGGVEEVTLSGPQIPTHSHPLVSSTATGTASDADGRVLGQPTDQRLMIRDSPSVSLSPTAIDGVGGSQPHENRSPYLAVSYIISLFGLFPSQD